MKGRETLNRHGQRTPSGLVSEAVRRVFQRLEDWPHGRYGRGKVAYRQ